jgi:hypothetical protein
MCLLLRNVYEKRKYAMTEVAWTVTLSGTCCRRGPTIWSRFPRFAAGQFVVDIQTSSYKLDTYILTCRTCPIKMEHRLGSYIIMYIDEEQK